MKLRLLCLIHFPDRQAGKSFSGKEGPQAYELAAKIWKIGVPERKLFVNYRLSKLQALRLSLPTKIKGQNLPFDWPAVTIRLAVRCALQGYRQPLRRALGSLSREGLSFNRMEGTASKRKVFVC